MVYLYVVIATVFAFRIGRPLIRLSFLSERLTANFRYALVRLRENAENVAFYQGEGVERATLRERFLAYVANLWARVYRGLKFDGFNLAVSRWRWCFPSCCRRRAFSGAIKLGDMMQTSQAFGQVQDALSFFRTSYDTFAQYRATLDRLSGFLDANEAARALPAVTAEDHGELALDGLSVQRPDGRPMVSDLDLRLLPGQALLIKGRPAAARPRCCARWPACGPVRKAGCAAAGRAGAVPVAAALSAAGRAARGGGVSGSCRPAG